MWEYKRYPHPDELMHSSLIHKDHKYIDKYPSKKRPGKFIYVYEGTNEIANKAKNAFYNINKSDAEKGFDEKIKRLSEVQGKVNEYMPEEYDSYKEDLIKTITNDMTYINPADIKGIYVEKDRNNKPHFNVKLKAITISNITLD